MYYMEKPSPDPERIISFLEDQRDTEPSRMTGEEVSASACY